MNHCRSTFTVVRINCRFGQLIGVIDHCNQTGAMSVTNDAENVVEHVLTEFGSQRIVYCDTDGRWDELGHDGKRFTRFEPLAKLWQDELNAAVKTVPPFPREIHRP